MDISTPKSGGRPSRSSHSHRELGGSRGGQPKGCSPPMGPSPMISVPSYWATTKTKRKVLVTPKKKKKKKRQPQVKTQTAQEEQVVELIKDESLNERERNILNLKEQEGLLRERIVEAENEAVKGDAELLAVNKLIEVDVRQIQASKLGKTSKKMKQLRQSLEMHLAQRSIIVEKLRSQRMSIQTLKNELVQLRSNIANQICVNLTEEQAIRILRLNEEGEGKALQQQDYLTLWNRKVRKERKVRHQEELETTMDKLRHSLKRFEIREQLLKEKCERRAEAEIRWKERKEKERKELAEKHRQLNLQRMERLKMVRLEDLRNDAAKQRKEAWI